MDIRGASYGDVQRIIAEVSRNRYAGNVTSNSDARALLSGGRGFRGRLQVRDSRGEGARTSASGRHGRYACWHAYRDVLAAIFAEYPDAKVRTRMARYDGREGFEANYPATGRVNIGSRVAPARMPQLCQCQDEPVRVPVTATVRESTSVTRTYDEFLGDIDALLADVAADGWTNPYGNAASPARRLSEV